METCSNCLYYNSLHDFVDYGTCTLDGETVHGWTLKKCFTAGDNPVMVRSNRQGQPDNLPELYPARPMSDDPEAVLEGSPSDDLPTKGASNQG